jgi:hypothetical protein
MRRLANGLSIGESPWFMSTAFLCVQAEAAAVAAATQTQDGAAASKERAADAASKAEEERLASAKPNSDKDPRMDKKARRRKVAEVDYRKLDVETHSGEYLNACKTEAIQFLDSHAADMTTDHEKPALLQESLDWETASGNQAPFPSHGSR